MNKFSSAWKGSKNPKKKRKYLFNAPKHTKRKFFTVQLSEELRKKHGKRNFQLRKGDKVKIMIGQFRGQNGAVNSLDTRRIKVNIDGIQNIRKSGARSFYPIHPSNLQIIDLNLDDKLRKKALERKKNVTPKEIGSTKDMANKKKAK
ncbi:MAG TPA: 50S ribosomal protein L24 [Candidatus Nanoarchaeia archaeon]|nr:50S ribosomal protein L24 [Candidatus Nanoarchaeia archaeon]